MINGARECEGGLRKGDLTVLVLNEDERTTFQTHWSTLGHIPIKRLSCSGGSGVS
jgi:hypothetical protein